jgi:diaminopimelate decarboxylase
MSKYVVVGHNCESGDLLTCQRGNPDEVKAIDLPENIEIGDYAVIRGTGAYCSSMSLKNYNSYPESAEVLYIEEKDELKIIRKR